VLVLGTQTVTLVKASFTVVKVCGCGPASTVSGCRFTGLMITVVVPDFAVFSVEVAVMVTVVGARTTGAVKVPLAVIDPALAIQVTPVVKLPVPVTVAEHPINWLDWMGDGKQLAVTPVMVNPLLLEPQAANHNTLPATSKSLNLHILPVSLMDVAGRVVASRHSNVTGTRFGKLTSRFILPLSQTHFLTTEFAHGATTNELHFGKIVFQNLDDVMRDSLA